MKMVIKKGSSAANKDTFQFVAVLHGAFNTGTTYTLKVPLVKTPATEKNLNAVLRIEECPNGKPYCFTNTQYEFTQHARTVPDTKATNNVVFNNVQNAIIQSLNLRFAIQSSNHGGSITTNDYIVLEWDKSQVAILESNWPNYQATGWTIEYYKFLEIHVLKPGADKGATATIQSTSDFTT